MIVCENRALSEFIRDRCERAETSAVPPKHSTSLALSFRVPSEREIMVTAAAQLAGQRAVAAATLRDALLIITTKFSDIWIWLIFIYFRKYNFSFPADHQKKIVSGSIGVILPELKHS